MTKKVVKTVGGGGTPKQLQDALRASGSNMGSVRVCAVAGRPNEVEVTFVGGERRRFPATTSAEAIRRVALKI